MSLDASKAADCSSIIKAFEKHMLSAPTEGAIIGTTLPKLASIQSNSSAASKHLRNLVNPPISKDLLSSFNNDSQDNSTEASIPTSAVLGQTQQRANANNWQAWLAECIPCDLRIDFRAELLDNLDDQLLDILEQMINNYLKILAFIMNLLNATDVYADVCPILFAMRDVCIPDLQRIISLLASILYRMTVRELTGLDLMKLLVLPIFQPIFSGLLGILNMYKNLITDPLNCVLTNLDTQLNKLKVGSVMNEALVNDMIYKADALGAFDSESDRGEARAALNRARQPFQDLDEGITAMQDSLGTAVFQLRRLTTVGIFEIETLLDELKSELAGFLGIDERETIDFLLNQYQKLMIFRLISFIAALVKALTLGFNCNFDDPAHAEDTVSKFLNDFLGPDSPVIVTNGENGEIQLFFNPAITKPIKDDISLGATVSVAARPTVLTTTGNTEIDKAFDAIISSVSQPVTVKPSCVFEPGEVDSNKLAGWIKDLQATEGA